MVINFLAKTQTLCQSVYLLNLSSNNAENQLIICSLEQGKSWNQSLNSALLNEGVWKLSSVEI